MKDTHPIQPLVFDVHGVQRFKSNAIVRFLLDEGEFNMNDIARKQFSREDREQFAQLIGYSHSGSSDLEYMSDEVWETAGKMSNGVDERDARIEYLEETLKEVRSGVKKASVALFRIHPDDLEA